MAKFHKRNPAPVQQSHATAHESPPVATTHETVATVRTSDVPVIPGAPPGFIEEMRRRVATVPEGPGRARVINDFITACRITDAGLSDRIFNYLNA